MTTTINKTNGAVLTTIADGAVDLSATNIALIGRLYRNYGELVNENMVKLLENFANATSPSAPIIGQLWFDTGDRKLKVFRSSGFVPLATNSSSASEPTAPATGDTWYDTVDAQLKFYNGTAWIAIAPTFSNDQGRTGSFAETIQDTLSASHVIVKIYQGGTVIATFSADEEYTPAIAINGFTTIKKGATLNNSTGYRFAGTATNADLLDNLDSTQFLRRDIDSTHTGNVAILGTNTLTLGPTGNLQVKVGAANSATDIVKTDQNSLRFLTDNNELVMQLNDTQQVVLQAGSAAAPSLTFNGDLNTGVYATAADSVGISTGGTVRLTVDNSGILVAGLVSSTTLTASGQVNALTGVIPTLTVATALTAPTISGNTTFNNNLTVVGNTNFNGNTIIGNASGDTLTITGNSLSIPNGLNISSGNIDLAGSIEAQDVTAIGDLVVGDQSYLNGELLVQYNIGTGVSAIRVTPAGRVTIGTTGTTGRSNAVGDLTLGSGAHVMAANTAKFWVVWSDNADGSGFFFRDSHDVLSVTRTGTPGLYRINLDYAMTAGEYWSVVGMSAFGTMQIYTFGIGGTFVDVYNQTLDTVVGTNASPYNSVVAFGQ